MNVADSERVAGDYESRGYRRAASVDEADEIVINTCSVRQSAEDRVMGLLHNLSLKFKTGKKRPKVILTGCMLHYGSDKLRQMLPTVDEFLPISEVGFNNPSVRQDTTHAWVPISSGCNSFCTFCIVPLSRGRERSRPQAEIVEEIKDLVGHGYRSVTLLGQNVNSYGLEKVGISLRKRLDAKREIPAPQSQYKPFKGLPPFVRLLEKLCQIKALEKINFITSNPWDFYEELIDCIADHPQIERLIHLPVQSGDNTVLQRMNRGYTREQYLTLIDKIRAKIPEAEFGTDIIVGFPGETREQFEHTVDLCKRIGFKVGYVARYSPRPGTASAKLFPDDIPYQEKKRRWKTLDDLINQST
jgi:tRNA-2-methylthio-N6-dimethylallyladenosine synthase